MKHIRGVRVGYVGGLHRHIDFELLEYLAREKPDWSIVLIGPDQLRYSQKEKPGNIIILGQKGYEKLPDYINAMDLCVIPYKINEYTKTVYPTKINEYLMTGKPVISTDLPEVEEFNRQYDDVVSIARSKEEFLKCAESRLVRTSPSEIQQRKDVAMTNTWEKKIKEMNNIIERELEEKAGASARSWRENLSGIYHASKKKMIKIVATVTIAYFIVFYSPLIWFLAEPLKITEAPRRADAIVVFGGGVGETGSPGKSTIERARYSANLFKKGYGKIIIFSSGYTFKGYDDASNMKLFAMSMSIPGKDIILEQKAGSTYENVKFTAEILKKKGLDSILLVSAKYNMRRASLVFNSIAKDLKVTYCPVLESEFYARRNIIEIRQIEAILHEYLGILYYIYKGYIKI